MKNLIRKIIPPILINVYKNYKKKKRLLHFQGSAVECPFCSSTFSHFASFGIEQRANAQCPNCGSLERHRLLWKYFNDKTNLFKTDNVQKLIHFAPEQLFYNVFSNFKNIEYTACDLNPERYAYNGNTPIIQADITKIPYNDNSFDVVYCSHVLEHVPNDALAMSELYRVLKQGGWAILQVPIEYSREKTYEDFSITTDEGRLKAFGMADHVRIYGQDYKHRLENAGFIVTEDNFVNTFTPDEVKKYGFDKSELIYFCEKK